MLKSKRYIRNLEQGGISLEEQEKLMSSRVLVMGAGGLGSGVIMNLAALGIGQIKIIDGDIIEESNFNRQLIHKYKNIGRAKVMSAKDWIQEFNSDIKVDIEKIRLSDKNYLRIIQDYDIIVDCFDSYESKYLLNQITVEHSKILVHGAVQGFKGQVTTIVPEKTGCLACIIDEPNYLKDEVFASISPVVNAVASFQAQEVLKLVTGQGEALLNKILIYDALETEFKLLHYTKSFTCKTCSDNPSFHV